MTSHRKTQSKLYGRRRLSVAEALEASVLYKHGMSVDELSHKFRVRTHLVEYAVKQDLSDIMYKMTVKEKRNQRNDVLAIRDKIENILSECPHLNATEITVSLESDDIFRHRSSVHRHLVGMGLECVSVGKALPLTIEHKKARVAFCERFSSLNINTIVFSDEKLFMLENWRRKQWVPHGERPTERVHKFPPRVMVWGGISRFGKSPLVFIRKTLGSDGYCEVLGTYRDWLALQDASKNSALLLQDNARIHVSQVTRAYMALHSVKVVPGWPPNSP
jgi:hypothetical protein